MDLEKIVNEEASLAKPDTEENDFCDCYIRSDGELSYKIPGSVHLISIDECVTVQCERESDEDDEDHHLTVNCDKFTYLLVRHWARLRKCRVDLKIAEYFSETDLLHRSYELFGLDPLAFLDSISKVLDHPVFSDNSRNSVGARSNFAIWLHIFEMYQNVRDKYCDVIVPNRPPQNIAYSNEHVLQNSVKSALAVSCLDTPNKRKFLEAVHYHIDSLLSFDTAELIDYTHIDIPDYSILRRLGNGNFKVAYRSRNLITGHDCALLEIDPTSEGFALLRSVSPRLSVDQIFNQILKQEFSSLKFPGITSMDFIAIMHQPVRGVQKNVHKYFIPTQLYDHTLADELSKGPLPPERSIQYFRQMSHALINCHLTGIIHKDLKPSNIGLTSSGNILLTDFGASGRFSGEPNQRYRYPLHLTPPELAYCQDYWENHADDFVFTPEANVWSLGCIFYEMLTGKTLFDRPFPRAKPNCDSYHDQNRQVKVAIQSFYNKKDIFIKQVEAYGNEALTIFTKCLGSKQERANALHELISLYPENVWLFGGK